MTTQDQQEAKYRALVVDSGPIIRRTALQLWQTAADFYTVPAVLQEIRDAKARQHLDELPLELKTRTPSGDALAAVTAFARQTGDYPSLSSVDLQVLALQYELEREGCHGNMDHVRTEPKRMVGVGKLETLGDEEKKEEDLVEEQVQGVGDEGESENEEEEEEEDFVGESEVLEQQQEAKSVSSEPKSWAMLVNPQQAGASLPTITGSNDKQSTIAEQALSVPFGQMKLSTMGGGGQFSDAEEEKEDLSAHDLEQDLQSEFPSLAAASLVPYEGEDDDAVEEEAKIAVNRDAQEEARKKQALQPVSKSGKLYNSFRGYKHLLKPSKDKPNTTVKPTVPEPVPTSTAPVEAPKVNNNESRIIGGSTMAGQDGHVDDDGEGWIVSSRDLQAMKGAGIWDPQRPPDQLRAAPTAGPVGPPKSQRTACATTDFAMQNVILQMNLALVSVDGVQVRKLKSWVTRCGACFKVYTAAESVTRNGQKRLFCDRCGSDFLQRIAASVDGKTGRIRLHLSQKYQHNLRGTKFSLPKAGTNNRFQGDLLLREDQLMMGAWNQKVKKRSGGRQRAAAESMFGRDIASNVGCHNSNAWSKNNNSASRELGGEIRVGFGWRNPNAAKGRERRGKKKKSSDKACGLRRY